MTSARLLRAIGSRSLCSALLSSALALGATATATATDILYVDDDAAPGGDGLSWMTAMNELRPALLAARDGDDVEVRVAQGTYIPDPEEGDRQVSFELASRVALLGGFAGIGEADPDARDPDVYVTILSGDLSGDDGPDFENYDDNSLHVVTAIDVDASAVLSGVTIRAGRANGAFFPETGAIGAGLLVVSGDLTVSDCLLVANLATQGGSGMSTVDVSAPTVTDCSFTGNATSDLSGGAGAAAVDVLGSETIYTRCVFSDNRAPAGAAVIAQLASPVFRACTFSDNRAFSGIGGAFANIDSPVIYDGCTFVHNFATQFGGAGLIQNVETTNEVLIVNCLFDDNASNTGGALAVAEANPTILNSTFVGNEADEKVAGTGGAIASLSPGARPLVKNSILWDNVPDEISDLDGAATTAKYCDIEGGWPGPNLDVDPGFVGAGDYRLAPGSPLIDAGDTRSVPDSTLFDRSGAPRFVNDPCSADTGLSDPDRKPVDIGAEEHQPACPTDLDCTGETGVSDILRVLSHWGTCAPCAEDVSSDGAVTMEDLMIVVRSWGPCS